jgi:hypothetical protein
VLAAHRETLRTNGTEYPNRWSREGDDSHNGLTELLRVDGRSGVGFRQLRDFLAAHPQSDVLLSSESLSTWLAAAEMQEKLLDTVAAIRKLLPVTVVWTLRRFDEMAHSLYVQLSLAGVVAQPPDRFMKRLPHARMFAGMRNLEELVGGRAIYVKYDRGGGHYHELLSALGLSADMANVIASCLRSSRRLNSSRSHKQLVAAVYVDELITRTGVAFTKRTLLNAFDHEGLRFDVDRPCEVAGEAVRRGLHERALESARCYGFAPYLDFFEAEEVDAVPSPESLDVSDLSEKDLLRLASHLRRPHEP